MRDEPATLDLHARFCQQRSLFGAVEPQHRSNPATPRPAVRTERHVLDHAALAEQSHVLESAAQTQGGEGARRLHLHGAAHQLNLAFCRVVDARDHVEEGALSRPVGSDERMDLAGLAVHRHRVVRDEAAEALGHRRRLQQHFAARRQRALRQRCDTAWRRRCLGPKIPLRQAPQGRPQSVGETLQHQHHQQAEHDHLEVAAGAEQARQHVLQLLFQQRDDGRTEHRAPQMPGPADHRHEEVLDADVQVEGRWVNEALHVRVEPAGDRRHQRGQDEELDAVVSCVDAHRFRHQAPTFQCTDGTAFTRVEQVVQQPQADQQRRPDRDAESTR